jgi:hypothetical protein
MVMEREEEGLEVDTAVDQKKITSSGAYWYPLRNRKGKFGC